jgi:hypothetical protein
MLYWLACAWITVTAVLLALLDLLLVRAQARVEKRSLTQKVAAAPKADDAD